MKLHIGLVGTISPALGKMNALIGRRIVWSKVSILLMTVPILFHFNLYSYIQVYTFNIQASHRYPSTGFIIIQHGHDYHD